MESNPTIEGTLDHACRDMLLEVLSVNAAGEIRRRLLDMGLVKGSLIRVIRKAPLGDPVEIMLNGFLLTLRLEEAKTVHVKLIETGSDHPFGHRFRHGRGRHGRNWFRRLFYPYGNN